MQGYVAALTIMLLLGMVLMRVFWLRRTGTRAMHFGRLDKTDFLIPPFALFYFYTVFAAAFNLPLVSTQTFFQSEVIAWVGVLLCFAGLILLLLSLVSFGKSFRVGIDVYDADLWHGAIMASEGERAAFRDLCSLGLHDTLRIHHKEGELFSWWDYQMRAFEKNRGLRIDAVLTSESLAKKCIASGIDREMRAGKDPSDHSPVWAEFAT